MPTLESADPALAFVLCLARMADCDNVVSDEERALLDRMGAALDPPWTSDALLQVAASATLRDLASAIENPADRFFLAVRAWAMANADGMLDDRERDLFVELVALLGLDDADQDRAQRLVATQGHLDPELEQWLRETHADSSFSTLAPLPGPPQGAAGLRASLNLAQSAIQDDLLTTLRSVAASLLPDAGAERVSALSELLAEPRLLEVLDDLDRQAESDAHRLELLEANEDLRQHGERAEGFASRRHAARERIDQLTDRHAAFARDDFQWLYSRNHHADHHHDAFQQFVRVVTLAPWRERRAEEDALTALSVPDFRCAVEEYHRLERDLRNAERELERVGHAETALEEMLLEREDLRHQVESESQRRLVGVREALVEAFTRTHLSALYPSAPEPQQAQLARCCALEAKLAMIEMLRARLLRAEREVTAARAVAEPSDARPGDPALLERAQGRLQALIPQLEALRLGLAHFDDLERWRTELTAGCPEPTSLFAQDPELRALARTVLGPPAGRLDAAPTVLS